MSIYMDKLRNKYVIGTHVMWFEIEMYADFINGMVNLLETVENKENVIIDLCFNMLQHFEEVDTNQIKKHELVIKFKKGVATLESMGFVVNQEMYITKNRMDLFLVLMMLVRSRAWVIFVVIQIHQILIRTNILFLHLELLFR